MPNRRRLLLAFMVVAAVAGSGLPPALAAPNAVDKVAQPVGASFEPIAENADFTLLADRETLGFQVVDKRNGYVWNSGLVETTKDDKLNKAWTAFAQSGVSIDYLDKKAISKRVSITNGEHTLDFKAIDQGFEAAVVFTKFGIGLTVRVVLEPAGVRVEVPQSGIQETDPDYRLGAVHVYPFLGAVKEDQVPGYMFLPDGSGSLINFAATTKAKNIFYGRYYGQDLGMIAEAPWDPTVNPVLPISIPVVGMAHDDTRNAYIAVVEDGAAYGEVNAHPAGVTTKFNFIYSAFIYNESFFQATNRSGAGVTAIQPVTNKFDVKIHYRFLANAAADYVGMARSYQQYLLDRGDLQKRMDAGDQIGLRLEFLGGEKERVLLWYRFIPMTTVEQMGAILKDLGMPGVDVTYYGWQPLGAASMPPETLSVDGGLGSAAQLEALAKTLGARNGHLSLYLNPQAALRDEGGYSPRNDLAMAITNVNLIGYDRQLVHYYFTASALKRRLSSLSNSLTTAFPSGGLALEGLGATVYSDFRDGQELSRDAAIGSDEALLAATQQRLAFYRPSDFAFRSMNAYYDIPLSDNGFLFTSKSVPFLQIVLAGYVPYYGPALNFSSNARADLLRQADYGVYPAYFLTQDVTAKILNTSASWIYTSSYAQWGDDVRVAYDWLNRLLGPVKGQPIIARAELAPGVVSTTYGNGKQIVVNYTDAVFQAGGIRVGPKDAALVEKQP